MNNPPRLLVVEDSPTNQMIFRDILTLEGYVVREATTAEEAFAIARSEPLDLILMDVQLPGMDGFDAVQILKGDPATRLIPIVALTAHALQPHRERAMKVGCDGYITKPIRAKTFRDTIRSLISSKERPDEKAEDPGR